MSTIMCLFTPLMAFRSKNKKFNQVHLGEPMSLLDLVKGPHRLEVMLRSMGDWKAIASI